MIEMIKIASNQLDRTPNHQVVKVAGILRRLKNLFKSYIDPEFQKQVQQLENESMEQEDSLKDLVNQIEKVQLAIKDKELEEYREELNSLNKLLKEVYEKNIKLKNYSERILNKVNKLPSDRQEEVLLPEDYDIPLDQIINKLFSDSEYYSNKLNNIKFNLTDKSKNILQDRIRAKTGILNFDLSFDEVIKNAIFKGTIIKAELHRSQTDLGIITLNFTSAPFMLPGFNKNIIISGKLTDMTTGSKRRNIISYQSTDTVNTAGSGIVAANQRLNNYNMFLKQALDNNSSTAEEQKVDQFINKLDGLAFAKALEKGYKKSQGKDPTLEVLAFGWSQAAAESYDGITFNLKNNNVGNLRAFPDWISSGHKYFAMKAIEFLDGKKVLDTKALWRSYDSPEDGAAEYWKLLFRKFPQAIELASSGKHHEAVTELGTKTKEHGKYFTADIDKYSAAVQKYYKIFMEKYSKNFSHLPKYNEENLEKDLIKNAPKAQVQDNDGDDEVDLSTSKESSNLLTSFVKQALYKNNNPKKYLLIQVQGSDSVDNLEYANHLSYLIQDYLKGTTTIHKNNNFIQIEASMNTNSDFRQAVFELSDLLSNEINKKINKNVYTVIAKDLNSFYPEIDADEVLSNHRKFLMRYS